MNWQGMDRRNFPRVVYPCMVKIKTAQGIEEAILSHTENIGLGGLCVIIKKDIKIFSEVNLEVDLLDTNEHLKAKGRVVWTVRRKAIEELKPMFYDIGIEFTQVTGEEKERLSNVLTQLIKKGARFLKPYA